MEFYRPTIAEISLAALAHNLGVVRRRIPAGTGVLAMVKADAYGHGAVPVARRLAAEGVEAFGVATVEEGSELRAAGIASPILVMGGLMGGYLAEGGSVARAIVAEGLTPVIHSVDTVAPLEAAAKTRDTVLTVHVKIDTGMTRLGLRAEQVARLFTALADAPHLRVGGVFTHLAFAADPATTDAQARQFREVARTRTTRIGPDVVWHIANSGAIIRQEPIAILPGMTTWVRPGIMLYGIAPFPEDQGRCDLHPVMTLKSRVILIKQVPAGTTVSYGCTWTAPRPSRIGVIPVGYADGYPWALANRGKVLIGGRSFPVIGRVTMDFCMVDLTDGPSVRVGAEAVLMGRQGDEAVTAEDLAEWAGTIPYEIICRISKRMPRKYVA